MGLADPSLCAFLLCTHHHDTSRMVSAVLDSPAFSAYTSPLARVVKEHAPAPTSSSGPCELPKKERMQFELWDSVGAAYRAPLRTLSRHWRHSLTTAHIMILH